METVDVEGLAIAFERVGTGPPLVLLHGGLSDHREWRRQLEDLSDARTVVAWDAPGCGRSDDPPPTFRLPDYARTLALLLDLTGAGPAAIIGLSWGSSLAIELYRQRPDIPSALILAGPYAGWAGSLRLTSWRIGCNRDFVTFRDRRPSWLRTGSRPSYPRRLRPR